MFYLSGPQLHQTFTEFKNLKKLNVAIPPKAGGRGGRGAAAHPAPPLNLRLLLTQSCDLIEVYNVVYSK